MKNLFKVFVWLAALSIFFRAYASSWEANSPSCHNGKLAPTKETLLHRYLTPKEFLNATKKAVSEGEMPQEVAYSSETKELYGRFLGTRRRFHRKVLLREIEGKIVRLEKVAGFGRRGVKWWTIDVRTGKKTVKVWLIPVWRYPSVSLKIGDKVKVKGFVPFYWQVNRKDEIMACLIKDERTGALLDFTFRPLCKKRGSRGKR